MTGPITSFGALRARFFPPYQAGDYQGALDVLRGGEIDLPHHAPILAYWEMALLSLQNRPGEAMAQWQEALDAGYWAHEDHLRGDPDFAAMLAQPGAEALMERMREARLRDASEIEPLLSIMEPEGTAQPWPLLMVLHGDTSNLNDFAPHWIGAAQAGWLVAAPQSVQPAWVSGFFQWGDAARARHQITHHLHTLRELYALEEDRIVVGGFSRGGEVTLRAALDGSIPARGFIGVEGWLFDLDEARMLIEAADRPGLRCYLVAGEGTDFHRDALTLCDLMQARGIPCALELTAVPHHAFPADFDAVLGRALNFVLGL